MASSYDDADSHRSIEVRAMATEYRLIRISWEIRTYQIDGNSGQKMTGVPSVIHASCETLQEAEGRLSDFAEKQPYTGAWLPKNRTHDYQSTEITRRETLVHAGPILSFATKVNHLIAMEEPE